MATWIKTKHTGVRYRESNTKRHKGRPEKYFSIRYKSHGRTKEEGVGWEGSGGVTPQYAANIRAEITTNIRTGQGFQSLKERREAAESRERAERSRSVTLGQAFEEFLSTRQLKPRSVKDYRRFMESALSAWTNRAVIDVTRDMVSRRHKQLGESIGAAQANSAFRFMRSLINFCIGKYEDVDGSPLVKHNPVLILTQTRQWFRLNQRQTIIKNKDLPKWFKAVAEMKSSVIKDYILTILLSGLRKNEVLQMEQTMVDLEERTISLLDTKNNKPFQIPIPKYLYKVLKARIKDNPDGKYVFPGRVIGQHLKGLQWGFNEVTKASKVEFCSHDMRRLFITQADALDLSPFVIKRLVNHSAGSGDVTGGYIVSDLERLRKPMQQIEDKILFLAGAKKSGKVVKLKSA